MKNDFLAVCSHDLRSPLSGILGYTELLMLEIENKIQDLFSRYSRISRKGTAGEKSTGLGLAIAKELVQHHNGTITVKSREGKGSVFKVSFPIHRISLFREDH